eukprot:CAMPEP_0201708536 /NCGR_PEP_ID=MMETSP0578-20130828/55933_1 /ASSEMBLY_ACC=CAM_ASM_000663 /TAXON_ID=267565 /ORGANISM="Skeletonema grethea, Strain CCMP 1804" /LENGTH=56 /DNA_ID=CAMNT_0048197401 /DNA_START=46 /DNA_END=213 /DNA_ORIENTATION=-
MSDDGLTRGVFALWGPTSPLLELGLNRKDAGLKTSSFQLIAGVVGERGFSSSLLDS